MLSPKRVTIIALAALFVAVGIVAFAAEKSSRITPLQRSTPAFTAAALSPGITVTSPAGGSNWPAGSSQTVAWNYSGNIGPSVSIRMLKGTTIIYTLSNSVSLNNTGKGIFTWTVPKDAASGTDYSIVVASNTNTGIKGNSGLFSMTGTVAKTAAPVAAVSKLNLPPGIEILTPHSGDKWPSGETHELKWRVTGIPADPKTMVKIRKTSWDWPDIYDTTTEVPMTGSHQMKLTTPPGQKGAEYLITASIVDPATNQKYESTIDGIMIGSPYIQIVNLAELTAAPWVPGKTYKVSWKVRGTGSTGGLVIAISNTAGTSIYLSSAVNEYQTSGTYEWTAKAFTNKMKFSITPQKSTVEGTSFNFDVDTGKYPVLSPALTAPAAPSLSAKLIDYKQYVELQWTDNSGNEKEFMIERKYIDGGRSNYAEIGRVPANAATYQDKAVTTAGHYRYRVKAVNDNGSSASNEVDITTIKPGPPVDLVPVNPHPEKGLDGYCPAVAYTGSIDITIRNLGPGASGETNAVLFVSSKQSTGYFEQLKTVIPVLQEGKFFVWHAQALKCLEGGPDCKFNLMINYNPKEVLESDMSSNDIYFTCKGPVKIKSLTPGIK